MRVVRLGAEDVPAILAVFRASVAATAPAPYRHEQVVAWSAGLTEERLIAALGASTFVGARGDDSSLLGFANLVDRGGGTGELDLLYVLPDAGGRGVARALVAEVERLAAGAGIRRIRVDASLLAAPVLEHLGYAVERRYHKQVGGVSFPNAWLRKALTPPAPTA